MDVTEVLWTLLSNILNKHHSKLNQTIHTLQWMEHANMLPQRELVKLLDLKMLLQIKLPNSRLPSNLDQLLLQLKLIKEVSKLIQAELSLLDAEPALITES
jgi:hypothetical protein